MSAESESKKEGKYWCLTVFCNNDERHDYYEHPSTLNKITTGKGAEIEPTFICGQEEKCPETGRWHRHVYIEFKNKVKFNTLKRKYPQIRIESRKGTAEQARHYAQKDMDCEEYPAKPNELRNDDGQRFSFGTISDTKPGKRTDLERVITDIKSGMKRKQLADTHGVAVVKYHKGLETLARWNGIDLDDDVDEFEDRECHIWFGAARCGKTLAAKYTMGADFFERNYYRPQKNNAGLLSFEDYMGQKWIWLDDFEPKQINAGILKEMMEAGLVKLPGRGSFSSVVGRHTGLLITSQMDPETWYDKATDNYKVHFHAISGRCQTVWQCGDLLDGDEEKDQWTIVGGKQFPRGHTVPSPLLELQNWMDEKKAETKEKRQRLQQPAIVPQSSSSSSADASSVDTSVEYSDISQASQIIDLSQDD